MDRAEYGGGGGGAGSASLRYLDLEVVLNAQQQDGTAPKGV